MSDVETLQQLVERRLREMGKERGRDEPLTLLEAYRTLPASPDRPWVTYELLRRVWRTNHHNIGDRAADTLATMLAVPKGDVMAAARKRAPLAPFTLPERADRLTEDERRVVLSVVDAILSAGEGMLAEADREKPHKRPRFVTSEASTLSASELRPGATQKPGSGSPGTSRSR